MTAVDRAQLADLLRTRREALQPEDVGLPRGPRRRTGGLRREEVAALAGMSSDYYGRIEQQRGPHPSEPMLASLARALRLTLDERDHLFRLGGHVPPSRHRSGDDHVDPGVMRILDRLQDTPAMVLGPAGETLVMTPPAVALFGDDTAHQGLARSAVYRWFTDPAARRVYPEADHALRAGEFASDLRVALARDRRGSLADRIVRELGETSQEFRDVWAQHEVRHKRTQAKRLVHPEVGEMELYCQTLLDVDQTQALLVFTAEPGSVSAERLELLAVIGRQSFTSTGPADG